MKTTLRAALALGLLGVLAGPAAGQGDGRKDMAAVEAVLFTNLKDVINKGVDLYNGGDIPGCYRLFEGTLRTLRPLVEHRPMLVKEIDDKLAAAEKEGVAWRRAFALRAALDKVRSDIRPKDAAAVPAAPEDETARKLLKAAEEKRRLDEELKRKDDENLKKLDEEARRKAAEDLKKRDDEELKRKLDDEVKKKAEDDKKKKEIEDDKKPGEKKDDKDAPPVLRKPKELKEKDGE